MHIYGHLKRAFLIPESYLIEHAIIYSSHELILVQGRAILDKCAHETIIHHLGQLENTASSLVYSGPCLIQIELAQCGLKPLVRVIIVAFDME